MFDEAGSDHNDNCRGRPRECQRSDVLVFLSLRLQITAYHTVQMLCGTNVVEYNFTASSRRKSKRADGLKVTDRQWLVRAFGWRTTQISGRMSLRQRLKSA